MNLDEYQSEHISTYEEFADTVKFIVEKALSELKEVQSPQLIQRRAKSVESTRRRLSESGKLDTQELELERRDLAGVRLVFYTNTDVDRFLRSGLIHDNFEIEEDSAKVHHPTPGSSDSKYRGVHYTVRLRADRTELPEYRRFLGLRCEVQIQTILNHAWSETSHDVVYKKSLSEGFGSKTIKGIKRRFDRIMDEFLIPAGYEIQKAQHEYESLLQGKEILDKDAAAVLDGARNNNERYEVLSKLKDFAIPHVNDRAKIFDELKAPLLRAAKAARETEPVQIETTFGKTSGFKSEPVLKLIVEIIESFGYTDPVETLKLLANVFRGEASERVRKQILDAVRHLSEYNISAYQQVGTAIQQVLVEYLGGLGAEELDDIRPIALVVWKEAVQSDITGTKWSAEAVTLSTGAVPASADLTEVRSKAMKALFEAYDRSVDDAQRREIISALDAATRTPTQGGYSNELLSITLRDGKRIVDFLKDRASKSSYELLQHVERGLLYDARVARQLAEDPDGRFNCKSEASALLGSIIEFRDLINSSPDFLKYKVLVGFESVFPQSWKDERFDFHGEEEFRKAEADRYISEIDENKKDVWFSFLERCAGTKSNDGATFRIFGEFIRNLAERKPEIAESFLIKATDEGLRHFLPGFLNGLSLSSRPDIYKRVLESEMGNAKGLFCVARHLRHSEVVNPELTERVMKRAIETKDPSTVTESIGIAVQNFGTGRISNLDAFVRDALAFLNSIRDSRWIYEIWHLKDSEAFYDQLSKERVDQVLENLSYLEEVDLQAERVLERIAARHLEEVWDFFGDRLSKEDSKASEDGKFEAVPFEFHSLKDAMSKDPKLAIKKGLMWFQCDKRLFQFRGGRVLSNAFPRCPEPFAKALLELVKAGGEVEAEFVLATFRNFHGEASMHPVLREIVFRYSSDRAKMSAVGAAIDSTGVVSGDSGFAIAFGQRRELLNEWLKDDRDEVRDFAQKHIDELEQRIASEHQRSEASKHMRSLDYDGTNEDSDESGDDQDDPGPN